MLQPKSKQLKILIIIFLLLYMFFLFVGFKLDVTPEAVRDWVLQFGLWAPIVFVLAYWAFIIFPALPNPPLLIASGLAFGLVRGFILAYFASVTAYIFAFWLSRTYGKRAVKKFAGESGLDEAEELASKVSKKAVASLRLVPGFSYDLFVYAIGLGNMKLADFLKAFLIPNAIAVFIVVAVGDISIHVPKLMFLFLGVVLAGFIGISFLMVKKNGKKTKVK